MCTALPNLTSTDKSVCATLAFLFLTTSVQLQTSSVETLLSVLVQASAAETINRHGR
jgi:hypothetical protein